MVLKTVRQAKRFFMILLGFTLLLLGLIGWALPILPGWAFFFAGLAILAAEFVWARRLLERLKTQGARLRDSVLPPNNAKDRS